MPELVETSKSLLSNISAWCGRRDGGMILNSNDLKVAPPHTRGVIGLSRSATRSAVENKVWCAR
jgi:hypothetical protein